VVIEVVVDEGLGMACERREESWEASEEMDKRSDGWIGVF
jgi:hypothetical protein